MNQTATFLELDNQIKAADAALKTAIERDRSEAEGFWKDVIRRALNPLSYGEAQANFEIAVGNLKARAEGFIAQAQSTVTQRFGPHQNKPDQLDADAEDWISRSQEARKLASGLATMSPVDGWTGDAADEYGKAVQVQRNAMMELSGVMQGAGLGAKQGSLLNQVMFALGKNTIEAAMNEADVDLPGGGDYYYRRTAWWGDVFQGVPDVLEQILGLTNLQAAIDLLNQQLDASLTVAQLLEQGSWPTGVDAADVPPGNTSVVTTAAGGSANFDLPDARTPGVCTQSAKWG